MYYPPRFLFRRFELVRRVSSGDTFLEIGPGSFNLTKDMLKFFKNGVLVDYNSGVREHFDSLNESEKFRLTLEITDFTDFVSDEKFSTIIACEVLEHIENEIDFLKNAYSLLESHGQLILSVPARKKYWSIHDEGVGHLRRYEKMSLTKLLEAQGFNDICIVSYGFPFVNMLRWPRMFLAKKQQTVNSKMTKVEQTKESGLSQYRVMMGAVGFICNKYTIAIYALFASLFNSLDLSNGYVVTARK